MTFFGTVWNFIKFVASATGLGILIVVAGLGVLWLIGR